MILQFVFYAPLVYGVETELLYYVRLLVLPELINQNEVFRSILVLILLHTVKQIMRCVEFYVSKNFLPSFTFIPALL